MKSEDKATKTLLGMATEGGALRRALGSLDRLGPDFAAAIRRAVPFVARRGVPVKAAQAKSQTLSEIVDELETPIFSVPLATDPGGSRAALIFDGSAIAFLLEGVLGGDGESMAALSPEGLSAAQNAIVQRLADKIIQMISIATCAGVGFGLAKLAARLDEAASKDGAMPFVRLDLGAGGANGSIVLAIAKDALLGTQVVASKKPTIDARVAATLENVELEVVAELGRLRMPLGQLMSLRVGDTLRLHVPVGASVPVRVDDSIVLDGVPTTSGTQLAIRVVRRHGV